jgi:ATP phosphoribosyltransferase
MLREAGIDVDDSKRQFLLRSSSHPAEILFLRDDDIPQAVAIGVADIGIVGYNEVLEKGEDVEIIDRLGFGNCRISLAVPKGENYTGLEYFNGRRIATSYPNILSRFLKEKKLDAKISVIEGSVEIAPTVGMSDAIFDIVSSGGTLVSNGLKEVEKVIFSEAVLIQNKNLSEEKLEAIDQVKFRLNAVKDSKGLKYLLMNIPNDRLEEAIKIVPAMRSPTILPLAQEGWSSLHSVVKKDVLWEKIEQLKQVGAEGILVLSVEKMVL